MTVLDAFSVAAAAVTGEAVLERRGARAGVRRRSVWL